LIGLAGGQDLGLISLAWPVESGPAQTAVQGETFNSLQSKKKTASKPLDAVA
jgi:hypothetical protein